MSKRNKPRSQGVRSHITVTDVRKRSKRGRLALSENFETVRLEELGDRENLLVPVFRDGKLLKGYTFDEVRGA
jgi:nicotinamide phosphoribosyltransferase